MSVLATALPSGTVWAQEPPAEDTWGEKTPPENYVRSKGPSTTGSAYNWKQMAAGAGVMGLMGLFIIGLVRRAKREDDAA